ncbi:HTH-type transcriptional repressor FabR [Aquimonas voraii]|uniref:Transcriptional regulator, TetR family n=1 Tax=Aquimonas voraii TaxID=265719 RepID=A0A1G6XAV4_9GAMM|nr:transcriptional regulator, TetR family [Aquimonas voraii]
MAPCPQPECVLPPSASRPADHTPGRKPSIAREDLIAAALRLIGPHRSVSTLSLREVAREADIAPNSFYRHFRDIDELAVALIELSGEALRRIVGNARKRAGDASSIVRSSIEVFIEQVRADDRLLHVLLREGTAGTDAFKAAVDRELGFFEDELHSDLVRINAAQGKRLHQPRAVARAITRLVFAMGATAIDAPRERDAELIAELSLMVRMILAGARSLAEREDA